MGFALALIGLALIGLYYGYKNQNKVIIRNSIIAMVVITILGIVYLILYSMNPY